MLDFDFEGSTEGNFEFYTDDAGLQFKFGSRYDFNDRWTLAVGFGYKF